MSLTLRGLSLIALAGSALALVGCSNSMENDYARTDRTGGPVWFDANGNIIDHSPADSNARYAYDNNSNRYEGSMASQWRNQNGQWHDNRQANSSSGWRDANGQWHENNYQNTANGWRDSNGQWHDNNTQSAGSNQLQNNQNYNTTNANGAAWAGMTEDTKILSILHAKNQKEIEIGRLAKDRASSDDAKKFGEMLVTDHTDADAQVRSVAQAANITLVEPSELHTMMMMRDKDGMSGDSSKHMNDPAAELRNLQGSEFDRALGQKMADAHHQLIEKVTAARSKVSNPQVRNLLDKMLPTLRHHEEMAQKLANP